MTTRAYRRISLDTERSGSIGKQTDRLTASEVAAGRDPQAIAWYKDESVSGSKIPMAERPDGARLLTELESGDRVIVTNLDRVARNVRDLLGIVERVESAGASIRFIDQDINTEGAFGRFMLVLLAGIAELEAGIISERRKASLESFTKDGRHAVGKAPFGFHSVPNPDGRGLVIAVHPENGPKLRAAVLRVLAGESQNQVRQSIGMSKTGFHKLLNNPRLAGMTPDGNGVVMADGVPRVNPDAAILSLAEWERLKTHLHRDDKKSWSKQTGYGKAIRCGVCGQRLYVNLSKRKAEYSTYRCRKALHKNGEPSGSVMAHAAEKHAESVFLELWGSVPYRVKSIVSDDMARREAVALANVRITEIERRMREAGKEERRELNTDLMAAYDALEEAEAMRSDVREEVTDTGLTIAQAWAEGDPAFRENLLVAFGGFVVNPGNRGATIDERMVWVGPDPRGWNVADMALTVSAV